MKRRINTDKREEIIRLIGEGQDRDTIAALTGVTPAQVSAIRAHISMGSYKDSTAESLASERARGIPSPENKLDTAGGNAAIKSSIYIGKDLENGSSVYWNPLPTGSANPHVLIVGESGFGKTYTAICLIAELARRGLASVVLDYGQGFSPSAIPKGSWPEDATDWLDLATSGVSLNPLTIVPSDVRGPASVAQ